MTTFNQLQMNLQQQLQTSIYIMETLQQLFDKATLVHVRDQGTEGKKSKQETNHSYQTQ